MPPIVMHTLRSLGRSKRLLGLNALLAVLSVSFSVYIIWQMTAPLGSSASTRPVPSPAVVVEADTTPMPPTAAVYAMVGSRNVFSPTRTDTQKVDPAVTIVGQPLNLFGVVLAGDRSIAYLEDPVTKRVYAYRLGDSVGGGTIRAIEASHVVLERRNQRLDVQLHDPSRPKPSLPVAVAMAPGAEVAARPAATDRRSDTVGSAPVPAQPAVPTLTSRPPASRFGIVAPAVPRVR